MRTLLVVFAMALFASLGPPQSRADIVFVVNGQSNLFLDPVVLAGLGISISGTTGTVTPAAGYTVAYPISARNATPNTTFSYDPNDFLGTFAGVIEHTGTLSLQSALGTITLGDFTVGYDAARADATRSGFFIGDNRDLNAPLFDIAATGATILPTATSLQLSGSLLLSLEAATGLGNPILAGLNMGNGFVDAVSAVPEPSSLLLLSGIGSTCALIAQRRRRRTA